MRFELLMHAGLKLVLHDLGIGLTSVVLIDTTYLPKISEKILGR